MNIKETIQEAKYIWELIFKIICWIFIALWFILWCSYYMTPANKVQASSILQKTGEVSAPEINTDPNLTNNKPTPRRRLNENWYSQRYIPLTSSGRVERMKELLSHYDNSAPYEVRQVVARIYRVYPEALICIAYADTSLGNFLKTPNNIGNVGNNDRWDTLSYSTQEAGVNAIGKVLTNQYLWDYNTIDQLSRAFNLTGKIYASSTDNRHNNVTNCIGMIRNKGIPDNFAFRW